MSKFLTLHEICELYFEEIRNRYPTQKAECAINEFRSGLFRFLLPEWGLKRITHGRKMTEVDVAAATEYTKTIYVQRLLRARDLLRIALDKATVSP